MGIRRALGMVLGCMTVVCSLYGFQEQFRQYPAWEYNDFPLPPDWNEKGEWVFARLMYPTWHIPYDRQFRRFTDWTRGLTNWTIDYPRSDRRLSAAVRRLTRLQARSVEQPVNLDDGDDVYNWPFLYGVQVGEWGLTDAEAKKLREYLLRGGFFMADDFHGTVEWQVFEQTIKKVFPDRPIVDIPDSDPIFHTVYDLDERYQIPGAEHLRLGYKNDGYVARWR